jgi:tRNA 2-selenouridine synthase SelU
LFETRTSKIIDEWNAFKQTEEYTSLSKYDQVTANISFMKEKRCGDYLIKVGKNNKLNYVGQSQMYIDYSYLRKGWFALGPRRDAQWFSAEIDTEASEKHGWEIPVENSKIYHATITQAQKWVRTVEYKEAI